MNDSVKVAYLMFIGLVALIITHVASKYVEMKRKVKSTGLSLEKWRKER